MRNLCLAYLLLTPYSYSYFDQNALHTTHFFDL